MKINLPNWLKNRYAISLIGFGVYMIFFNDADIISVYNYRTELHQIQEEIHWYNSQTAECRERLEKLEMGGYNLEKLAREKHYLQREDEDVFIVKSTPTE